jgi:gliding motility-associated-like protein
LFREYCEGFFDGTNFRLISSHLYLLTMDTFGKGLGLLILLLPTIVCLSQGNKDNKSKPQITGQTPSPVMAKHGSSVTITLGNLIVNDPDPAPVYPDGFTLEVNSGNNYKVSGTTVKPDTDFAGMLTVRVRVDDGKNKSQWFDFKINVEGPENTSPPQNGKPQITGQVPITINQGQSTTITFGQLAVIDPDDNYPAGFTLTVYRGNHYTLSGTTITPDANFFGNLKVPVSVNDGQHESNKFDLKIEVLKKEANVAPTIIGQRPINITQSTPFTLQLFDLIVDDPDNDFPTDFVLKIFPGTNYTINGTSITPAASLVSGTLTVKVKVNDGRNDSPLFEVKIQITPISATPRINGQRELTMMEDSTFTLKLTDLVVTDADNPAYPRGFTLNILSDGEGVYKASGKTITLAPDLNGLIEVGVTVSDGKNTSDEYRVVIFVEPVNDAPRLTLKDNSPLNYEPGKMPADLFSRLELVDVDNEFLSMAEIGFRQPVFSGGNDEILFEFDTTKIRVIRDPSGILFLIGYAKVEEYQAALRSMKYNYRITLDQIGEPEGILTGSRTIYVNVNDGQSISVDTERKVNIEGRVVLDIPTAFTPNGDNANDTWHLKVSNHDLLDQTTIRVYNKRGLLIFESNRLDREWDGRYHGELVPSETYYYTIIVDVPYSKQTFSGVVTILY